MLAIAKYPTIVRQLANLFKDLPAIITPAALKSACRKAIIFAHEANDTPAVQREMLLYDHQRMSVCTGLPRIMEQLGLLHPITGEGNKVAKERIVALGHGRPTKQYRLAYDKSRLKDLLQKTSSLQVPEHLSNDALLAHHKAISAIFDQWPSLRSTSSAGNSQMLAVHRRIKIAKKQHVDTKQQLKLGYLAAKKHHQGKMSKETHGSSVPASAILK